MALPIAIFPATAEKGYGNLMSTSSPARLSLAALAMMIGAALLGLGLAGWLDQGARLFVTLAEAGLAWCF